ncbi:very-long-chain 3-oxoacyl-CoA reductase-B-like isoform X3 [Mobula birostris]|uniref:very-long-chain 3-oxoacyl-CoA reductase-B-like isoform X3 n=1 Tax=Mobula birostris TaxID=1983395 RepID=UPI003B2802BD
MFLFTNIFGNSVLALIGAMTCLYYLVKYTWKLLFGIRIYILSKFWKIDLTYFGEWAVVTGATNGIGKAYAHELARRGLNIVLISRSLEKLKTTADEIGRKQNDFQREQKHGKKTKIIQADFTAGTDIYGPIQDVLNDMNIGILVNNVGKIYDIHACCFLDVPDIKKAVTDIIYCNALSVPMMTAVVLPQMVERKKGVIINISSEAGAFPFPMLTMYSATKVFIDFFSRALNVEYKSQGIITQYSTSQYGKQINRLYCGTWLIYSCHSTRTNLQKLFVLTCPGPRTLDHMLSDIFNIQVLHFPPML